MLVALVALAGCSPEPARVAPPAIAQGAPGPACDEVASTPGPWPRAESMVLVAPGSGAPGELWQRLARGRTARLRFLGAHLFDLLDKLEHEAGATEIERRRVICASLNAVAAAGAPVVRIWGTLKRTGTTAEIDRAAALLALVLDEDARRARPIRVVVTLLNHQSGYGAPRPEASLDDQDPEGAWSARRIYLGGSWRARGVGQLAERIERLAARPEIAASPYVLAWEVVNELDSYRAVAGGSLSGPEADALRDGFLVPALEELSRRLPQPIMVGDLRGAEAGYASFARGLIAALPEPARSRLIWTSHVYVPAGASAGEIVAATRKLDLDLALAAEHGLPFVLGELGEHARDARRFCGEGAPHDPARLFSAILDVPSRAAIDAAIFWGDGQCGLAVPGSTRRITIGAGGDSADLAPGDAAARDAVRARRRTPRFLFD